VPHAWEYRHDEVGYNYRLPNINAALGCAQLERLPEMLAAKRVLFQRYEAVFSERGRRRSHDGTGAMPAATTGYKHF
jgi:dTDP-4-amino-4,6-dideoxygalactose transaminase